MDNVLNYLLGDSCSCYYYAISIMLQMLLDNGSASDI